MVIAPTLDLAGRRALVTGAGSGIGRACAMRLAAAQAAVIVLDIDERRATSVADEVGGEPIVLDLSDVDAVASSLSMSTSW